MKRILRTSIAFAILMVCHVASVSAQIRGNNIVVSIAPDHSDWNYKVGETANFTVRILRSNTPIENVEVEYEQGPEMYPVGGTKKATLKNGEMKLSGKMTKPGFYRVNVKTTIGGKEYRNTCAAAFSPEKIQANAECPADFDEFWSNTIAEARKVDLDPHRELLPSVAPRM